MEELSDLYIEFKAGDVAETRALDENTQVDLDRGGNICGITIEHARTARASGAEFAPVQSPAIISW
jgi:uncharacterized protein YuzE